MSIDEYWQVDEADAAHDIRLWFTYHDGKCPNCGLDMKTCHPLYNIYPHWTGICKKPIIGLKVKP